MSLKSSNVSSEVKQKEDYYVKNLRLRFDNFIKKYATFEMFCISGYTWDDIRSYGKSKLGGTCML